MCSSFFCPATCCSSHSAALHLHQSHIPNTHNGSNHRSLKGPRTGTSPFHSPADHTLTHTSLLSTRSTPSSDPLNSSSAPPSRPHTKPSEEAPNPLNSQPTERRYVLPLLTFSPPSFPRTDPFVPFHSDTHPVKPRSRLRRQRATSREPPTGSRERRIRLLVRSRVTRLSKRVETSR